MKTVYLRHLFHKNRHCIAIQFQPDSTLAALTKLLKQGRFSYMHRCWYVPYSLKAIEDITVIFKQKAFVNITELTANITPAAMPPPANKIKERSLVHQSGAFVQKAGGIAAVNQHILPAMKEQLALKAYSPSTVRTYLNEMTQLLLTLKNIPADNLKPEHLRRYFVYCLEKLCLKENTLHSRINALKFYYEQVLGREKFFWEIPRPKKHLILPKVLGEDELARLFNALTNIKHKALLFTAYSAGLRVSEVSALKISDIDSGRMQIFVENAKGKKDRYVNLSPVLLDILRAYIKQTRRRPAAYLFESEQTGGPYPVRTIQRIFQLAKEKAGISKDVGIHSLRHSFATHMLEKGVDIKYIKELLGHFNIKTTERYLHVSKQKLVNISSPLDDLWRTGKIDW